MSALAFLSALLVKYNGNDHKSLLTLQTELNYTHQLTTTPAFCILHLLFDLFTVDTKLYIPSTINPEYILWQPKFIVDIFLL